MMDHRKALNLAAERASGRTRVTACAKLDDRLWLKREDLQRGGSFKMRGVMNVMSEVPLWKKTNGTVCVSTGNTGYALALLAGEIGVRCHIFMPLETEPSKIRRIHDAGGIVVATGGSFAQIARSASDFARSEGLVYCSPGSSWSFAYGVGTIGLELEQQLPQLDTIYVPMGGGGLATGLGVALLSGLSRHRPRLIGVQAQVSPYLYEHFYLGRSHTTANSPSVADALVGEPEDGATILQVAHEVLSEVVLVNDEEILMAQAALQADGITVEPSAAAGLAAALRAGSDRRGDCCVVLTGAGSDLRKRGRKPLY